MRRKLDALLDAKNCFAVMQIDMTQFKEINDTYGHNAGDAVLCHFADILNAHTDPDWIKARTGGMNSLSSPHL